MVLCFCLLIIVWYHCLTTLFSSSSVPHYDDELLTIFWKITHAVGTMKVIMPVQDEDRKLISITKPCDPGPKSYLFHPNSGCFPVTTSVCSNAISLPRLRTKSENANDVDSHVHFDAQLHVQSQTPHHVTSSISHVGSSATGVQKSSSQSHYFLPPIHCR